MSIWLGNQRLDGLAKDVLSYDNITNCITEIPQDIKLELSGGTLTLKAGSKVYIPNGPGVFNLITTTQNYSLSGAIGANNTKVLIAYKNNSITTRSLSSSVSGPGATTSGGFAFDTTANKINFYSSSGALQSTDWSFPIAIVSTNSSGVASSIDQVFNGFGYIGSTVFALPGVKGLIPNGRNEDGSLKNTEVILNDVITFTDSYQVDGTLFYAIHEDKTISNYFVNGLEYRKSENLYYYNGNIINNKIVVFSLYVSENGGKIKTFTPKTAFRALDYNDTDFIAHNAMPSERYVNLTLGASGTRYTAPADGYFSLSKTTNGSQWVNLINSTSNIRISSYNPATEHVYIFIPAKKGDVIFSFYTATGTTEFFRFVYAEGSK